ncbi:hypothetical protein SUGI_0874340 [Cryptomeria japonica]|nr:hypothetical protein SUGI_0874340 [Cryptomeria japonica]
MEMSHQHFPSVKIPEVKDDYLKFEPRNTHVNIVNALLRVMIAEVPTIAVDLVEIGNNSSVLNDEFVSQKLGLIPLTSKHAIEMSFLCDCDRGDGNAQCKHCSLCVLVEFETKFSWSLSKLASTLSSCNISRGDAVFIVAPIFMRSICLTPRSFRRGRPRLEGFCGDVRLRETRCSYFLNLILQGLRTDEIEVEMDKERSVILHGESYCKEVGMLKWRWRLMSNTTSPFKIPEDVNVGATRGRFGRHILHLVIPKFRHNRFSPYHLIHIHRDAHQVKSQAVFLLATKNNRELSCAVLEEALQWKSGNPNAHLAEYTDVAIGSVDALFLVVPRYYLARIAVDMGGTIVTDGVDKIFQNDA